jgi:hypothetical protein
VFGWVENQFGEALDRVGWVCWESMAQSCVDGLLEAESGGIRRWVCLGGDGVWAVGREAGECGCCCRGVRGGQDGGTTRWRERGGCAGG